MQTALGAGPLCRRIRREYLCAWFKGILSRLLAETNFIMQLSGLFDLRLGSLPQDHRQTRFTRGETGELKHDVAGTCFILKATLPGRRILQLETEAQSDLPLSWFSA
jgi:hypothetical protein